MATKPQSKKTSKSTTPAKAKKSTATGKQKKSAKTPSNSGLGIKNNEAADTRPKGRLKEDGTRAKFHSATPLTKRTARAAGIAGREVFKIETEKAKISRRQVLLDELLKAKAEGDLPHVFLLKIMRGTPLVHQAFDHETGEIVDMVVLPTFQDRLDAAHKAAPYFSQKLPVARDPNPQQGAGSGVMETPLVDNLEQWTQIAAASQAKLKEEVTK